MTPLAEKAIYFAALVIGSGLGFVRLRNRARARRGAANNPLGCLPDSQNRARTGAGPEKRPQGRGGDASRETGGL